MAFKLILNESNYHGEGNLTKLLIDIINKTLNVNLDYNDYIVHHLNGNHDDWRMENIALIKSKVTDMKLVRMINKKRHEPYKN